MAEGRANEVMMILFRSILFAILFYANNIFWFIIALFGFLLPHRSYMMFPRGWSRTSLWIFEKVIGSRLEIRGLEKMRSDGVIVAAKHQSSWETMALLQYFDSPAFIYKRELNYVPLFGWHLMKSRQIPVNRGGSSRALLDMLQKAKTAMKEGRQILIFPEGTRKAVGAPADYKQGLGRMYQMLKVPCVPVALNSGLAWPRRRFLKFPYTIIIEFLDPIPPGLPAEEFMKVVEEKIETATARIVAESLAEKGDLTAR